MSFLGSDNKIWLDGCFVSDDEAQVSIMNHTMHYGAGVFEGVRAYDAGHCPAIFRLEDHTDRFFNSAKLIGMELPFDKKTINSIQKEIIKVNGLSSAYLRPMAFYGSKSLGVDPKKNPVHVMVAAWTWGNYFDIEQGEGMSICTSSFSRQRTSSVLLKAKVNGYYVNSMLALQDAKAKGFQEAVLLDGNGFIAEGSSANIFLVKNGTLYTPTDANILPGITRDSIFQLSRELGYSVVEKDLTRDELYLADEIFFTGTAAEVTSVGKVDGVMIGTGKRGKITSVLSNAYHLTVEGKNEKYCHWNAFVE